MSGIVTVYQEVGFCLVIVGKLSTLSDTFQVPGTHESSTCYACVIVALDARYCCHPVTLLCITCLKAKHICELEIN